MAHGAPDHVRMGDVNVTDYTDKTFYIANKLVGAFEWYYPVDVIGVGCVGLMYFKLSDIYTKINVQIDGTNIFNEDMHNLWTNHIGLMGEISNYVGISKYDDINQFYSMWIDWHYLRPFKESFKIGFKNNLPPPMNVYNLHIYYKLKE